MAFALVSMALILGGPVIEPGGASQSRVTKTVPWFGMARENVSHQIHGAGLARRSRR